MRTAFYVLFMLILLCRFPIFSAAEDHKSVEPQIQEEPTTIKDFMGDETTIWPKRLPEKMVENWKYVVGVIVEIRSKDKNRSIPKELDHPSLGSGYLIEKNNRFYVQTVGHLFSISLERLIEYTKYSAEIFEIHAVLIEKQTGTQISGLPLDLVAYEGAPYDFAIFEVRVPRVNIVPFGNIQEKGASFLRAIDNERNDIDWFNLRLMPETASRLAAAHPLKIAEPRKGETIYICGYRPLGGYGTLAYQSINFFSKTVKNVELKVGDKKMVLKKAHVLKGQVIHGLSGSGAFNDKGELIGIFREATEDGSVAIVASAEDYWDFLKRHDLGFLIDDHKK